MISMPQQDKTSLFQKHDKLVQPSSLIDLYEVMPLIQIYKIINTIYEEKSSSNILLCSMTYSIVKSMKSRIISSSCDALSSRAS